ncbi:MAG: DUF3817 domain-containing protein [Ornithinimicrobium sp.]
MTPHAFYRYAALAEAATWTLLLIGMFLKYVTKTTDLGVTIAGGLHGLVFVFFCVATVVVAVDQLWSLTRTLFGLAAAVPPLATVPFERWAVRRGLVGQQWRLRSQAPSTIPERVVGYAVSRPIAATVVSAVAVAVVFSVLLALGPPVQVEASG